MRGTRAERRGRERDGKRVSQRERERDAAAQCLSLTSSEFGLGEDRAHISTLSPARECVSHACVRVCESKAMASAQPGVHALKLQPPSVSHTLRTGSNFIKWDEVRDVVEVFVIFLFGYFDFIYIYLKHLNVLHWVKCVMFVRMLVFGVFFLNATCWLVFACLHILMCTNVYAPVPAVHDVRV